MKKRENFFGQTHKKGGGGGGKMFGREARIFNLVRSMGQMMLIKGLE